MDTFTDRPRTPPDLHRAHLHDLLRHAFGTATSEPPPSRLPVSPAPITLRARSSWATLKGCHAKTRPRNPRLPTAASLHPGRGLLLHVLRERPSVLPGHMASRKRRWLG